MKRVYALVLSHDTKPLKLQARRITNNFLNMNAFKSRKLVDNRESSIESILEHFKLSINRYRQGHLAEYSSTKRKLTRFTIQRSMDSHITQGDSGLTGITIPNN